MATPQEPLKGEDGTGPAGLPAGTLDAYVRAERKKEETAIDENEVRVMAAHNMRNYISYTLNLLQVGASSRS